jgi:hypothetical protein
MNQTLYIKQKLKEFEEFIGKTKSSTPLPPNYLRMLENESITHKNIFLYREVIVSLMYAMTGTRPDLATVVSILSQYLEKPRDCHIALAIRVLRYLAYTNDLSMVYNPGEIKLHGYADASYATDFEYKSRSGYMFLLGNSLISWWSGKQSSIAQSAAEAEYYAAVSAANEAIWLGKLLKDLGQEQDTITISEDNQACNALTKNQEDHKRTKHIQVKYHVVRDYVKQKLIKFLYCPTKSQLADLCTKGFSGPAIRSFLRRINVIRQGDR